jgi:transcriptional regulator with XRE-family HTH domain
MFDIYVLTVNYWRTMSAKGMKTARIQQVTLQRDLGRRIVELRRARGWKQGDLARQLGVPSDRLGKWERGLNAPSLEDLTALAAMLEITLDELVHGHPPAKPVLAAAERTELGMHVAGFLRILKPLVERPGAKNKLK